MAIDFTFNKAFHDREITEMIRHNTVNYGSERYRQPDPLTNKRVEFLRQGDDENMFQHGVTMTLEALREALGTFGIEEEAVEEVIGMTEGIARNTQKRNQEEFERLSNKQGNPGALDQAYDDRYETFHLINGETRRIRVR